MICARCYQRKIAPKGSMKFPVCKDCYKKFWDSDYDKYIDEIMSRDFITG